MKLSLVQRAAVELFANRGFAATRIRDIGRLVNLNSASLYHYTGGKEELLVSIMEAGMNELLRLGQEAVDASTDPLLQYGYLVSSHVGLTALNPQTTKVIDHELRSLSADNLSKLVAVRDEYEDLWSRVFDAGCREGVFRLEDRTLSRLAVIEMCNGVANWFDPDGPLSINEIQSRFVDIAGCVIGVEDLASRLPEGPILPVRFVVEPAQG